MIIKKTGTKQVLFIYLAVMLLFAGLSFYLANAIPEGATISGTPTTDTGPTKTPASRQDPGGRIMTLNLNLEQQNFAWKAYVGNVSGTYVLKNSLNYSIYEWPLGTSISGEVYLSRSSSVNFSSGAISCASNAEMITEQAVFGMSNSATDNINNTFNSTSHSGFNAGQNVIGLNTCPAVALWVNDTVQAPSSSAVFQEVALHDGTNFVFASLLNNDQTGFDNTTKFDFQTIVAENRSSTTGASYFFYLELGS